LGLNVIGKRGVLHLGRIHNRTPARRQYRPSTPKSKSLRISISYDQTSFWFDWV
jgi:hypothetical protein